MLPNEAKLAFLRRWRNPLADSKLFQVAMLNACVNIDQRAKLAELQAAIQRLRLLDPQNGYFALLEIQYEDFDRANYSREPPHDMHPLSDDQLKRIDVAVGMNGYTSYSPELRLASRDALSAIGYSLKDVTPTSTMFGLQNDAVVRRLGSRLLATAEQRQTSGNLAEAEACARRCVRLGRRMTSDAVLLISRSTAIIPVTSGLRKLREIAIARSDAPLVESCDREIEAITADRKIWTSELGAGVRLSMIPVPSIQRALFDAALKDELEIYRRIANARKR